MTNSLIRSAWTAACVSLAITTYTVNAEETNTLSSTISVEDSVLFGAFNRCDIDTVGEKFADDLEFYHDISGLTDKAYSVRSLQDMCDRKVGLKRRLIEGSQRVFPVPGFGAIQEGKHEFCHPENGKMDCGIFSFLHVWQKTQAGWKVSRVVSYGH
ncbi:nuclear transport factor 2 family protein [Aestuariibacter sp. AA17]|uniref:Nuclear transport factor 2 family protein n=1 Tax=Fluctibacter corallii TaxID=2984329 RepID=A0ABT3AB76_9ALTE|nr:nuclear transport factor 2 family protein [Aestuariibacter sp. AA17]MCV2885918.1 nuclear transport factor 2 family protein [Aestuariibacter sp. AA17]